MVDFPIRPIDFSPLGQIPEIYARAQARAREQQLTDILAGGLPRGKDGTIDWAAAADLAARAGNLGGVESFSRLRTAEEASRRAAASHTETVRHNRAIENQPRIVGSAESGYFMVDRNGNVVGAPGDQPQPEPQPQPAATPFPDPGAGNVLPRAPTVEPPQLVPGAITQQPQPVPQPPPPQSPRPQQQAQTAPGVRQIIPGKPRPDVPILKDDPAMLTQLASQARSGDTSVFTNLGRGAQGPENIKVLRAEMARQDREAPRDDAEEELRGHGVQQAMRNAEYFGTKAGQRTLGTRVANIELAATEFKKIMPVVLQASDAVDRSKYTNLNQLLLAWKDRTGDPASVALGGAINTAINVYARAVNPTGASTVSDKDHAREQLQRAWSQGQIKAALAMMQQEIDLALTAPDDVREEWRRRFREGQKRGGGEQKQEAPQPTPKASGTTKSGVKWSIP